MNRFGNTDAKHLYELVVALPDSTLASVFIDADSRSQAAAIAKRRGYQVLSINMIG